MCSLLSVFEEKQRLESVVLLLNFKKNTNVNSDGELFVASVKSFHMCTST